MGKLWDGTWQLAECEPLAKDMGKLKGACRGPFMLVRLDHLHQHVQGWDSEVVHPGEGTYLGYIVKTHRPLRGVMEVAPVGCTISVLGEIQALEKETSNLV